MVSITSFNSLIIYFQKSKSKKRPKNESPEKLHSLKEFFRMVLFKMDKILFLDFETDGYGTFRPPTQKIVQLGYILGDKEVSIFNSDVVDVNPQVPHPFDADYLKTNGVPFKEIMEKFLVDLKSCEGICAHNAKFDLGCLKHELFSRCGGYYNEVLKDPLYGEVIKELLKKTIVDTMVISTPICKLQGKFGYKWPTLEELHVFCFEEKPDEILHDALNDCRVTKRSLEYLIESGLIPQIAV